MFFRKLHTHIYINHDTNLAAGWRCKSPTGELKPFEEAEYWQMYIPQVDLTPYDMAQFLTDIGLTFDTEA